MSSGSIFSDINPTTTSGTQLATILNDFKDAVRAGFCTNGGTRPTNLDAGGYWIDQSADPIWVYKIFDGSDDITVYTINTTTNSVTIGGSGESQTLTKISDDIIGPLLKFVKARTTGDQTLDGDSVGDIEFVGTTDAAAEEVMARIRAQATDNVTAGAHGVDIIVFSTTDNASSLNEIIRIKGDGKLGLGTSSPSDRIHVDGLSTQSNARVQVTEDSATAPKLNLKKSRVAGSGQTQTSDEIGNVDFLGTDQNGADVVLARVKTIAAENSQDTQHGSTYEIQTVANGATALVARLSIDNAGNVIISGDLQVDGTTTTVNSTVMEVADANITLNNGGNQASADDTAGFTVEMSDATDAGMIYDKDAASRFRIGEVGSEVQVADVSSTQTFTNKTINGGVFDILEMVQQTTPANPAAGRFKLYFKADGFLYSLNNAGTETQIGAGVGVQHNFSAIVPPAVGDDSGSGYAVGSRWVDTALNTHWVCVDASVGAAIWNQTNGGGGSAIEVEDDGNSLTTGVTKFNFVGFEVTEPVADEIRVQAPGTQINSYEDLNLHTVRIQNNGTASILSQSGGGVVASVNRTALGVFDVTFVGGAFANAPAVMGAYNEALTGDEGIFITSLSNTGFTVTTKETGTNYDADVSLEIFAQGSDVQSGAFINFGASRIQNNGTASKLSESTAFISSVNRTSTGTVDITFTASFFTQIPSLSGAVLSAAAAGDEGLFIQSITTSGCTVRTTSSGTAHDYDFSLKFSRQGSDYLGGATGSENFFGGRIQNNGTASVLSESLDFVASATQTATGVVDIVFSETFTEVPSISGSIIEAAVNGDEGLFFSSITTTGCTVETNRSGGSHDLDFSIEVGRQGNDYKGTVIYNGYLGQLVTDPTSPLDGQSWFNTTDKKAKQRIGGVTFESAAYT